MLSKVLSTNNIIRKQSIWSMVKYTHWMQECFIKLSVGKEVCKDFYLGMTIKDQRNNNKIRK